MKHPIIYRENELDLKINLKHWSSSLRMTLKYVLQHHQ